MENDTFHGDFYGKTNMEMSNNLICHVFSIRTQNNF